MNENNSISVIKIFMEFAPKGPIGNETLVGHDLMPGMRQAITWTNDDPV